MKFILLVFALIPIVFSTVAAQPTKTANFRKVVEKRLKEGHGLDLLRLCPIDTDPVAKRIFSEYGAIFVASDDTQPPDKCIFADETEVRRFQDKLKTQRRLVGGFTVQLQEAALNALLRAADAARTAGLDITPYDSLAAQRSYEDTVRLWKSRFDPALNHWIKKKKIDAAEADILRQMKLWEAVGKVLEWESKGIYFSTNFSQSILTSVAAPGTSQHLCMLAIDVAEHSNNEVRSILAKFGWFQTVRGDLPHFTYLGIRERELPGRGLKYVISQNRGFWVPAIRLENNLSEE